MKSLRSRYHLCKRTFRISVYNPFFFLFQRLRAFNVGDLIWMLAHKRNILDCSNLIRERKLYDLFRNESRTVEPEYLRRTFHSLLFPCNGTTSQRILQYKTRPYGDYSTGSFRGWIWVRFGNTYARGITERCVHGHTYKDLYKSPWQLVRKKRWLLLQANDCPWKLTASTISERSRRFS